MYFFSTHTHKNQPREKEISNWGCVKAKAQQFIKMKHRHQKPQERSLHCFSTDQLVHSFVNCRLRHTKYPFETNLSPSKDFELEMPKRWVQRKRRSSSPAVQSPTETTSKNARITAEKKLLRIVGHKADREGDIYDDCIGSSKKPGFS